MAAAPVARVRADDAQQQRAVEGLVALRRRERPALREDELLRVDAAERRVAAAVEHLDVLDVQHAEEAPEGEAAARVGRGRVQELRAGARLEEREVVGPHRRVADLGELALVREAPARRRDGAARRRAVEQPRERLGAAARRVRACAEPRPVRDASNAMFPRGHAPATASQASSVASQRFSARASAAASTCRASVAPRSRFRKRSCRASRCVGAISSVSAPARETRVKVWA